jgi:DNA-binding response OmpR family regulator
MARIVVMEDDAGTRKLVATILRKGGHEVAEADNGADGLALVQKHLPDLVVSDVEMPQLTGFQMLSSLRANAAIAHIPVILLTSLDDHAHVRMGMTQGADDYIAKPCRPLDLHDAVTAQLARAAQRSSHLLAQVDAQTQQKMQDMGDVYERRLARELGKNWPKADDQSSDRTFYEASVVYLTVQNFYAFSAELSPDEISLITRNLYGNTSDSLHLFGAVHMQFIGEDLIAVYADEDGAAGTANHHIRAARAALSLGQAVGRCKQYVSTRFASRDLPPLQIGIALHTGPVTLSTLFDPIHASPAQVVPVGDTITTIMRLRDGDLPIVWPLMATQAFVYAAPDVVRLGVTETIHLPGGLEVQVHAVVGSGAKLAAE